MKIIELYDLYILNRYTEKYELIKAGLSFIEANELSICLTKAGVITGMEIKRKIEGL